MTVCLAACTVPKDRAVLVLNDPDWARVRVQVVYTTSSDCDSRGPGYDRTQELDMIKNKTERLEAKSGELICYRHSDPDNPGPQSWSGWTKVTLFPGTEVRADL
ncbi:MAG TPA: hypothetical protein VFA12_02090 [Stellaceae bacterium]|nr:hypothetical protein [Stellaceae bacterium]